MSICENYMKQFDFFLVVPKNVIRIKLENPTLSMLVTEFVLMTTFENF